MQFNATQIANLLHGAIEGDATAQVHSFAKIEEAQAGDLCFLANPKYTDYIYTTQASIAIVNKDLILKQAIVPTLIRVENAYTSFAILLQQYEAALAQVRNKIGIEQPSFIHESASIGSNVYIGAFAYIGAHATIADGAKIYPNCVVGDNAKIGSATTLHAGVKIYHDCVVGNNCILHAGTVVGSDGFGFAKDANGLYLKIPQIGNVIIEDDVEIGANACLDRATMGSTIIRKGTKMDNMVQIAHNVEIGEHCVLAGMSAVAGSTKVGKHVMIGAQAGVVGHIKIADEVKINGQSGVSKSIEQVGMAVTGSPAAEFKGMMRSHAALKNLPDIARRITALEHELAALKNESK